MRSLFPPTAAPSTPPPGTQVAWRGTSRRHRLWIVLWCLWLIVPATVSYLVLTKQQSENRREAAARHAARMDPTKNDAVSTKLELAPPPGHEHDPPATKVDTGIYITRIPKYSIVEAHWRVDFYIWFSWQGDAINPGETFKIVSGEVESKTLMRKTDDGDKHYALYRVNADVTKKFDVTRFPRDEHVLTLVIEDQGLQLHQMVYTTNPALSEISSRVDVAGYTIAGTETVVKPHTYKTSMGDPALPPDYKATYSDFVMAVKLTRTNWGVFLKMFLPLYLAIALALGGMFVTGPAERLGLVSTALFVAVINGWTINEMIPEAGVTTLADVVSFVGYTAIGQTILQTVLYSRYFADREAEGKAAAAAIFDRATFVLVTAIVVALNVGILRAASG